MTTVINLSTLSAKSRQLVLQDRLPGHWYVGRRYRARFGDPGYYGNRYSHVASSVPGTILVATRSEAVARHLLDTVRDKELCERIKRELKDLVLVCFCVPAACHAQTLADIADGRIVS